MPFDETLTPPPPAYTPPTRRQGGGPDESSASYFRLTQSYVSIWSDCDGRDTPDRVSCFAHDVSSYQDPEDYRTLTDPNLPFLATIQSVLASESASAGGSSTGSSPTPVAAPQSSSDTSASTTTGGALTSQKPSSPSPSSSSSSNHTGAIIGGVIGGVVLLALAAAAFFFYRRRTARTVRAPSAEFMHMARGGSSSPILSAKHAEGVLPASPPPGSTGHGADRVPLARQSSIESDDLPPPFTPGSFKDPVYEKVQASAAMRSEYVARDVEGGYRD